MTNSVDSQKFGPKQKYISYDRSMSLIIAMTIILALVFVLVPIGQLYFYVQEWSKWQKFGSIIGWSVSFLVYVRLSTHANNQDALGAVAR